jgi:CheY-like chemotaxis protein
MARQEMLAPVQPLERPAEAIRRRGAAVVFADDDEEMRELVREVLEGAGFRVTLAADGEALLAAIERAEPDVVVTDFGMPDGGFDLLRRIRAAAPRTPVVVVTGQGDPTIPARAQALGIAAFFRKPVRMADLKAVIGRLLDGAAAPGA